MDPVKAAFDDTREIGRSLTCLVAYFKSGIGVLVMRLADSPGWKLDSQTRQAGHDLLVRRLLPHWWQVLGQVSHHAFSKW